MNGASVSVQKLSIVDIDNFDAYSIPRKQSNAGENEFQNPSLVLVLTVARKFQSLERVIHLKSKTEQKISQ